MKLLGAVLAGGRSSRFGSDKALALLDGKPLIEHAIDALAAQTGAVMVSGRAWKDLPWAPDRPEPHLGPLGGINAALHFAVEHGFDAVLTLSCDSLAVPADLATRLTQAGDTAFVEQLPVAGLWPARLAPQLDRFLQESENRSVRAWAHAAGAKAVSLDAPIANVNTLADLDYFRKLPD